MQLTEDYFALSTSLPYFLKYHPISPDDAEADILLIEVEMNFRCHDQPSEGKVCSRYKIAME